MEEKSLLLNLTGELPLFKIIDFLLENKGMDFSKSDIANGAEISRASLFNYWNEIEKYGIVKVTRSFGKTKLYTLNVKNPVTQKIIESLSNVCTRAVLFSIKNESKDATQIADELKISISTVYKTLSNLEELALAEVDKFVISPEGKKIKQAIAQLAGSIESY